MGVRLPALSMVVICIGVVALAQSIRRREFVASAVTTAPDAVLTAQTPAVVEDVLVSVGQEVRAGETLMRLASRELIAERDEVTAEIRRVVREAELARLEVAHGLQKDRREGAVLLTQAQRDLALRVAERDRRAAEADAVAKLHREAERLLGAGLMDSFEAQEQAVIAAEKESARQELAQQTEADDKRVALLRRVLADVGPESDLLRATAELHAAELDVLAAEKAQLDARIEALVVKAPSDGVVTEVAARGSVVLAGTTLAHVVPRSAEHVVAYVSTSETPPAVGKDVEYAVVLADGRRCTGRGMPRSQAVAVAKPAQLLGFAQLDSWGFPVRVALPEGCALPVGQVVELAFEVP